MVRTKFALILLLGAALAAPAQAVDQPGQKFHLRVSDLPKPYATPAVENSSQTVPRPTGALPQVPKGFAISLVASGLPL